jgi:signal transduction histidine kinase
MSIRLAPSGVVESDLVAPPVTRRSADVLGRLTAPVHSGRFWVALWALAAAVQFGVLVPVLFPADEPVPGVGIAFRLIGGSFAVCGLIAWHRRPDSRSGMLMAIAGIGFSLSPLLAQFDGAAPQTLATYLTDVWTVPFAALLLTYVTGGRLTSPVDRALVWMFFVALVLLQLLWMTFVDGHDNVFSAFPDDGIANVVDKVQRSVVAVACAGTIGVVAARWRAASRARRRALLPSVAGCVALGLFLSLLLNDLLGTGERSETHVWLAIVSLALVPAAFLAGLLRSRLARAGLTELFSELQTLRGANLQEALARAMGDRALLLARPDAQGTGFVDADGAPVEMPTTAGERRIVPVQRDGREIAALVYDASLDDDPQLVEAVSAAAAIALENEQLHRESQARMAELRASRERLVAAGDDERRRLERNLHDGAQQRLVALSMQLRFLQSRIREDPATAEEIATTASTELAESLQELRELARGIHPAVLDHGLEPAVESLASRSPVPTGVRYEVTDEPPPAVALAAYFVVSEALTNVAKYAGARRATVRVWRVAGRLLVEVADDGIGGAATGRGSGLRGLADRVEALDGRLEVVSPAGAGTVVTAELPCGA